MKYNFVEIGTSNFDTLIQAAPDNTVGLSVEPIQYYLDCLPEKPGVQKVKCAISRTNQHEHLQVYYVPEDVVREQKLPRWLCGCNSVGEYHLQHVKLNITNLVKQDTVECIPIAHLFEQYNVTELDYLKIDTEGSDCDIMLHLCDYIKNTASACRPRKIEFESNELTPPARVQLVISKFLELGYRLIRSDSDTVLEISST